VKTEAACSFDTLSQPEQCKSVNLYALRSSWVRLSGNRAYNAERFPTSLQTLQFPSRWGLGECSLTAPSQEWLRCVENSSTWRSVIHFGCKGRRLSRVLCTVMDMRPHTAVSCHVPCTVLAASSNVFQLLLTESCTNLACGHGPPVLCSLVSTLQ
jgi:hypothetical protein